MVEKGTKIELPSNITRFLTEEDKIKVDDETVATFKEEVCHLSKREQLG